MDIVYTNKLAVPHHAKVIVVIEAINNNLNANQKTQNGLKKIMRNCIVVRLFFFIFLFLFHSHTKWSTMYKHLVAMLINNNTACMLDDTQTEY